MALSDAPAEPRKASAVDSLVLASPPPLDPEWLKHECDNGLLTPRPVMPPLQRQPQYVLECRELTARMTAPGARDHHLSQGVDVKPLTAPSRLDDHAIPLLAYTLATGGVASPSGAQPEPDYVVFYIHGGGLHIGEADSEELSCRRILKDVVLPPATATTTATAARPRLAVYSVGYRLMPQAPASTCVADCIDGFRHVRATHPDAHMLIVGSSSGGELAAFVAQDAAAHQLPLRGVCLRCPVTSDAFQGAAFVPPALRPLHTSAANLEFRTTLLGRMDRAVPRDGLAYMPLEAPAALLAVQPRHWIQVCTNDMLYSDGVCYAKALEAVGVDVQVDVVVGWPHTFWLKTPWMHRALEADQAMLRGLAWLAGPSQ